MTGKNNEELLNIYDDSNSNDLFEIDNNTIKEETITPSLDIKQKDVINPDTTESIIVKEDIIEKEDEKIENEKIIDESFMDEISELEDEKGKEKTFFGNLFNKKSKNKINEISEDIKEEDDKNNGSSNIFDDFNQDEGLLDEVDQIKQERDRDMFYYLNMGGKVFQVIFILLIVLLSVLYSYIYVQNKVYTGDNFDNQLLGPFCFVLLNNVEHPGLDFCTSISSLKENYTNNLTEIKKDQVESIMAVIKRLYDIENFTKTKSLVFLQDKTEGKLQIIKILEEFDNLKNNFSSLDKQTIQCKGIKIDQKNRMLTMSCSAYSAGYESGIRGFNGTNEEKSLLKGTSISIANSFLNYINLESKVFTIIDRQKLFKSDSVVGSKTGFTNKTSFNLKLKYNLN